MANLAHKSWIPSWSTTVEAIDMGTSLGQGVGWVWDTCLAARHELEALHLELERQIIQSAPPTLLVSCPSVPQLDGEYQLMRGEQGEPVLHNGLPVWGTDEGLRLYAGVHGNWRLTVKASGVGKDGGKGELAAVRSCEPHRGRQPSHMTEWEMPGDGKTWTAAVCKIATPPERDEVTSTMPMDHPPDVDVMSQREVSEDEEDHPKEDPHDEDICALTHSLIKTEDLPAVDSPTRDMTSLHGIPTVESRVFDTPQKDHTTSGLSLFDMVEQEIEEVPVADLLPDEVRFRLHVFAMMYAEGDKEADEIRGLEEKILNGSVGVNATFRTLCDRHSSEDAPIDASEWTGRGRPRAVEHFLLVHFCKRYCPERLVSLQSSASIEGLLHEWCNEFSPQGAQAELWDAPFPSVFHHPPRRPPEIRLTLTSPTDAITTFLAGTMQDRE
eukprot:Sspe_Gene.7577::Locus_2574_Transcript_1_1_Confidence_1.000_Length_1319::g.7577::m.7577